MKIRSASVSDQPAWDDYVLKHPDGLAYHQFAWKSAVKEAYHFDSRYLLAERNGVICGVLPLIVFKRPFSRCHYVSLPYCDIGGCLADGEDIASHLVEKAKALGAADNVVGIELRTRSKLAAEEGVDDSQKVRMVLELPDSAELLLSRFKSKLRSQVKKSLRDGLTAQLGGYELISDFYRVFAANMRDLGSPVHSRRWIEAIVKKYAKHARIGLVFTADDKLAAVGIILLNGAVVSIPWASSLRRFNPSNPNMLLYWTFLKFAADNGYRYFDFGRSTPGEGTYKFKQQWGAKPEALSWINLTCDQSSQFASQISILRSIFEWIWKKMPLVLCNKLGPLFRRYISL